MKWGECALRHTKLECVAIYSLWLWCCVCHVFVPYAKIYCVFVSYEQIHPETLTLARECVNDIKRKSESKKDDARTCNSLYIPLLGRWENTEYKKKQKKNNKTMQK